MEDYIQMLVEPYLPEEVVKNRTKKPLSEYVWDMALEESNKGLPIMAEMEAKWYPELHEKKMALEQRKRESRRPAQGAPPPKREPPPTKPPEGWDEAEDGVWKPEAAAPKETNYMSGSRALPNAPDGFPGFDFEPKTEL